MKQLNAFLYARSALTLSLTSFVALSSASALAQLPTDASRAATGVASPDRVQEQFLDRELAPRVSAPVAVEDLVLEGMPANADQIRFNLQQIEFDGIGAYTAADIESIYGDKLGTEVSLADIYGIALALTNKYRNDGYILTRVYLPPQTIEGGVVKLRAVEGFVDNITVEGDDQESALKLVRQYASRIRSGGALNVAELEKFLLIINDLPGLLWVRVHLHYVLVDHFPVKRRNVELHQLGEVLHGDLDSLAEFLGLVDEATPVYFVVMGVQLLRLRVEVLVVVDAVLSFEASLERVVLGR